MEIPGDRLVTITCAKCRNLIDIAGLNPGDGISCPYCGHDFKITRQFGNFILESQLGAGGMGAVYLGRDVTLNRVVAVKVLRPELVDDQKFMATFLREAEITASLNHPNIVQVFAFGEHHGVYYMVVEYISGGSLDDKIANLGQITELEGIEVGIAVARGLECALERGGLIHRDIKPGNILFNANNTPKVVDFGLSLSLDTADHFDGEIWGTPYYVAPEKLEREAETFQSDLYSLGATLFHAMSGRPPYEGDDPNEVAMKHLSGSVISLKAFVPDISDQTAYAIAKSMARYPEDRYQSYAAFIEQLEDAKRRITDPQFHEKRQQKVEILETAGAAQYTLWLMIGMIAAVVIVGGLLIWKGSSLLHMNSGSTPDELNGYDPTTTNGTKPKSPSANKAPVAPKPPAPVVPNPPAIVAPQPSASSQPSGTLPPGWSNADIGSVASIGSTTFSNGIYSLQGTGRDIWGKADEFQFMYRTLYGNGSIVAHLLTQDTRCRHKSGVMMREDLTPGSRFLNFTVQQGLQVALQERSTSNQNAITTRSTSQAYTSAPIWLKLTRTDNAFTAYLSDDGQAWTQLGNSTMIQGMPGNLYVGLVESGKTPSAGNSTFGSVEVIHN